MCTSAVERSYDAHYKRLVETQHNVTLLALAEAPDVLNTRNLSQGWRQ